MARLVIRTKTGDSGGASKARPAHALTLKRPVCLADLYVATRASTSDAWSNPVNLAPNVTSDAAETQPSLLGRHHALLRLEARRGRGLDRHLRDGSREAQGLGQMIREVHVG